MGNNNKKQVAGELGIKLNSYQFQPGDVISGKINLQVNQEIKGKTISIEILGVEKTYCRGG